MQLLETLEKTEAITADVQHASQQLAVVNVVLEENLPDEVQVGDVAQAISQTGELEKKLAESAQALAEVSQALEYEIEKHEEAVAQLADARARSGARARNQPKAGS